MERLRRDVSWGIRWGIGHAMFWAVVMLLLRAPSGQLAEEPTAGQLVALYMSCGLVIGAIIGATRPFLRTTWGSTVVTMIALWPALYILLAMASGTWLLGVKILIVVTLVAIVGGAVGAWGYRNARGSSEDSAL